MRINGELTGARRELESFTLLTLRSAEEALERAKARVDEISRGERPASVSELLIVRRDIIACALRVKSIMEHGW